MNSVQPFFVRQASEHSRGEIRLEKFFDEKYLKHMNLASGIYDIFTNNYENEFSKIATYDVVADEMYIPSQNDVFNFARELMLAHNIDASNAYSRSKTFYELRYVIKNTQIIKTVGGFDAEKFSYSTGLYHLKINGKEHRIYTSEINDIICHIVDVNPELLELDSGVYYLECDKNIKFTLKHNTIQRLRGT